MIFCTITPKQRCSAVISLLIKFIISFKNIFKLCGLFFFVFFSWVKNVTFSSLMNKGPGVTRVGNIHMIIQIYYWIWKCFALLTTFVLKKIWDKRETDCISKCKCDSNTNTWMQIRTQTHHRCCCLFVVPRDVCVPCWLQLVQVENANRTSLPNHQTQKLCCETEVLSLGSMNVCCFTDNSCQRIGHVGLQRSRNSHLKAKEMHI